jgi:hypothetical protein
MATYLFVTSESLAQNEAIARDFAFFSARDVNFNLSSIVHLKPNTTFTEALNGTDTVARNANCLILACLCDVTDAADFEAAVRKYWQLRYIVCLFPVGESFAREAERRLRDQATVIFSHSALEAFGQLTASLHGSPYERSASWPEQLEGFGQ